MPKARLKLRKSAEFGKVEKIGEVGECLGVGKLEKIENWGGKIEKFSADRRAEWRKIETATGWRRQKIEKKSRIETKNGENRDGIRRFLGADPWLIRGFWRFLGLRACRFGSIQGAGSVDNFGARGLCITSRFGRRQFCGVLSPSVAAGPGVGRASWRAFRPWGRGGSCPGLPAVVPS